MHTFLITTLFIVSRYLHIVCTTLLVGGTLFYEMVVPVAIDDLKPEQQLLVFARARWVFKSIVWSSAVLLFASGIISAYSHWGQYAHDQFYRPEISETADQSAAQKIEMEVPPGSRPSWWGVAHASTGSLALIIALCLTIGKVPPSQPIRWMRLNLVILMLVMFLATATRQARLQAEQQALSTAQHTEP